VRILVVGATGSQGGGVARHLLRRRQFAVRVLTRRPRCAAACELGRLGAEVVAGDLANRATIRAALKDCYGVFGITSYSEHREREEALGMNLVNAVAGSTIDHFVLSALPPIERLTGGVCRSRQCQVKARIESYARSLQLPASYLHPAPYFETVSALLTRGARGQADRLSPAGPPRGLPAIAAEDIGGIVAGLFARLEPFVDRTIDAVGDVRPLDEYRTLITDAGRRSPRRGARPDADLNIGADRGAELDDMLPLVDFLIDWHTGRNAVEEARTLHPELHSFRSWLQLEPSRWTAAADHI
jgi:uncharacterized protein YbjT (DUF2867 family)